MIFFPPQETKLLFSSRVFALGQCFPGLLLITADEGRKLLSFLQTCRRFLAGVQPLIGRRLSLPARFAAYINCNL